MQRKILMIIVSLILILLFFSSPLLASEKLQIRIWADKNIYLVYEPIIVHYEIKNLGDSTFTVYETFDGLKGMFKIKNENGKDYFSMMINDYASPSVLQPDSSYQGCEEISDRYGVTDSGKYICFLPVSGSQSNVLKIKLIVPEGNEKKSLNLYLEAEKLHWCKDKDPEKWKLGFLKYLEVVEKYPHSVYAPKALSSASLIYLFSNNKEDKRKIIPVYKKLIENYPDSSLFALAFSGLIDAYADLKDKNSAIETMKELITKHPNTKISERAEYWLEKVEKWEFK